MNEAERLGRRIDAAMGRIPCDLILKRARFLDVFACLWRQGDIGIIDGTVVALESGLKATREIDLHGASVVPGFVDAHVHVESSMMVSAAFDETVLARGTTTAICDPHELANVMGIAGLKYFLSEATRLRMDLRVMLSSCVPATEFETNGAGHLYANDLTPFLSHSKALGLAEMMNVPGVLHKSPEVMDKLVAFSKHVIDGHCPLLRGQALSAYAAAGISSCHESTGLDEAREKLSKGVAVWIREGSVAKDLDALIPILTAASSAAVGFCTDDRNPLDIANEGHLDFLVRKAISRGVLPEVAFRSASWTVARHYGLSGVGAVAPGYAADLVVLEDAQTCTVRDVYKLGRLVSEWEPIAKGASSFENTIRMLPVTAGDFEGPKGRVHVIEVRGGSILTGRRISHSAEKGIARLSVVERYGKGSRPANAYVMGFGEHFDGAIASSVGHDSHNVIVVGTQTNDMQVATNALRLAGGGFFIARGGVVVASLALPFGGLMTAIDPAEIVAQLRALREASRAVGCVLEEPFLQLAFLSLPVIPSLKLTDKGLVDVDQFRIIDVVAA